MMTIERRLKLISILDKMERHPIVTKSMNAKDASRIKEKEITDIKDDKWSQEANGYEKKKSIIKKLECNE